MIKHEVIKMSMEMEIHLQATLVADIDVNTWLASSYFVLLYVKQPPVSTGNVARLFQWREHFCLCQEPNSCQFTDLSYPSLTKRRYMMWN